MRTHNHTPLVIVQKHRNHARGIGAKPKRNNPAWSSRVKPLAYMLAMITLLTGSAFVFLKARDVSNTAPARAAWYSTSWAYRKVITVQKDKVSGDHTNFPMLVHVTDADLASYSQTDADDILFTSSDGSTKLNHEIEFYNSSTGELIAWVQVPLLRGDQNTVIYLYYGNPSASNQQSVNNTWAADYVGVWHLNQVGNGTANEYTDSTSQNNHGRGGNGTTTMVPARISGKIGYAQDFDGTNDFISVADANSLDFAANENYTVSLWVRGSHTLSAGTYPGLVSKFDFSTNGFTVGLANELDDAYYMNQWSGGTWRGAVSGGDINDGTWRHLVVGRNGTTLFGYVDGANYVSATVTSWNLANAVALLLGCRMSGPTDCSNVDLDEVRIARRAHSAGWITTEYNNQSNPSTFYTYTAETGLLAWWRFDESEGSSIRDSGPLGFAGTITAAVRHPQDRCARGQCLFFNGSAYGSVTGLIQRPPNVTLSAWVRFSTTDTSGGDVISLGDSVVLRVTTSEVQGIFYTGSAWRTTTASVAVNDNRWHHLTYTVDTQNNIQRVYINGIERGSSSHTGSIGYNLGANTRIGSHGNGSSSYDFIGFIDEPKVYAGTISPQEVRKDFAGGAAVLGAGTPPCLSNGLSGYWKMDESSWTVDCSTSSVLDSSGNGNSGRACPNITGPAGGAAARFGAGGDFDGTDDYVSVSDAASLRPANDMTIAAWIYMDQLASTKGEDMVIAYKSHSASPWFSYQFYVTNTNYLGLNWNNETGTLSSAYSTIPLAAGRWYHVAAVRSGNSIQIYVDGNPSGSPGTSSGTLFQSDGILAIGSISGKRFDGRIDEVRLYNRALTPGEMRDMFNWAPGPVGWWKLDDGTGTSAADSGTIGTIGSINNPIWTNGRFGQGLNFLTSGTRSYVTISGSGGLENVTDRSFSFAAWFYPRSNAPGGTNPHRAIIARPGFHTNLGITSSGNLNMRVFNSSNTAFDTTSDVAVSLNTWHHGVGVVDARAGTLQVYLNGRLAATNSFTGTLRDYGTGSYRIGSASTDTCATDNTLCFDGLIDDVQIFDYPLTGLQVANLMNARPVEANALGSPVGSALGHWQFDEGYGTTANNKGSGGSTFNATLSGMASPPTSTSGWTSQGRIGKALEYDGSNDLVTVPDNSALEPDVFTVSAWAYLRTSVTGDTDKIIFKRHSASPWLSYELFVNASNQPVFAWVNTSSTYTNVSGSAITTGRWYHLVGVKDSDTIRLYVDGVLVGSASVSGSTYNSNSTFSIGGAAGTGEAWNGRIDEVKFYNFALTDQQVRLDYNAGKAQIFGSLSSENDGSTPSNTDNRKYCVPGDTASCNPPIGEWLLDENTGASANDTSGNANTGTISTGVIWVRGNSGAGLQFNGSSGSVNAGSASILDNLSQFTISAWIYLNGFGEGGYGRIVDKGTGTSMQTGWAMFVCGSSVSFCNSNSLAFFQNWDFSPNRGWWSTPANSIATGRWIHVATSYDNTNTANDPTVYIDGVAQTLTETQNPAGAVEPDAAYDLHIGNRQEDDRTFNGIIDTVRLYNYIRSPSQIAWEYNRGAPVGWWKLDECSGTTAYDASGRGNNGTITIGASGSYTSAGICGSGTSTHAWNAGTAGRFNSALGFDGTDDFVNFSGDIDLYDIRTGSMSWSAWINTTSSADQIVYRKSGSSNSNGFVMRIGESGAGIPRCMVTNGSLTNVTVTGSIALNDGSWHNITCVLNRTTNQLTMYVDSAPAGTASASAISSDDLDSTTTPAIGQGVGAFFNGRIDDVRIYKYPLNQTQINIIINEGAGLRYGPP